MNIDLISLIMAVLMVSAIVQANPTSQSDLNNMSPIIQSFSVYTDIGLVFDAVIYDRNEGSDINYAKVQVHETDNPSSPVICYFEAPTNLTIQVGGPDLQFGLIFKRLTPLEATNITSGYHFFDLNISDDNGQTDNATAVHYFSAEPHFINLNPLGSYIHRSSNNPMPTQKVTFTVYVVDYNTEPENLTVIYYWSIDGRMTWQNKTMIYNHIAESWATQIGPYPGSTEVYYYVTANDGLYINRTPALYDFLVWDPGAVISHLYLTLYRGWNLVSINIGANMTARDIVGNTYITHVIRLRNNTLDMVTDLNLRDFDLEYEYGYFIYASSSLAIALTGSGISGQTLTLELDWNLMGVARVRSCSSITSTSSIDEIISRNYYGKYTSYIDGYAEDFILNDNDGYFFHSTEAMEWYP